jgi:hypothetical protein
VKCKQCFTFEQLRKEIAQVQFENNLFRCIDRMLSELTTRRSLFVFFDRLNRQIAFLAIEKIPNKNSRLKISTTPLWPERYRSGLGTCR